jgi:Ribbon-helix-helix protein, copG family
MGTHVHMQRLHLYLEDRQLALLREEAARTGLSLGEHVRRAIDKVYRPHHRPTVRGCEISLGFWHRPDAAVAGRRPRPL